MIHCATEKKAGLVIVTRDSDYGVTVEDKSYINDHLRQEFSERVSRKRDLILYSRLSDALKLFAVDVSAQEEEVEKELIDAVAESSKPPLEFFKSVLGIMSSNAPRHRDLAAENFIMPQYRGLYDEFSTATGETKKDSK